MDSPAASLSRFRTRLLRWYRAHKRDLPWRRTADPYAVWISEIMLQQTTVPAVVPYFERWMRLFPGVEALARAPTRRVLCAWQGLGYYARARNLSRAAKAIVARHGGGLPRDAAALRALPGFGPYTAAAVLSLGFGVPVPVLEANVRRVMTRLLGIRGRGGARADRTILERLRDSISRRCPGTFNQAVMELGALICRPRNPACLACPVRAHCAAFERGVQEIIPAPKARPRTSRIEAVVAVIRRGNRLLIQKRPREGFLGGLWELPGGKIEPGETPERALAREIREELGVRLVRARRIATIRHAYTRFAVTLHAFECEIEGRPALDPRSRRFVPARSLAAYPFPSGSARILALLDHPTS